MSVGPDEAGVVTLLEDLLERAKAGNIQGIAVGWVERNETTIRLDSKWWRSHRDCFNLIGAIRFLDRSYLDYVQKGPE